MRTTSYTFPIIAYFRAKFKPNHSNKEAFQMIRKIAIRNTAIAAVILGLSSCGVLNKLKRKAEPANVVVDTVPLKTIIDSISYAVGVNMATYFKSQGVDSVNFTLINRAFNEIMNEDSTVLMTEMQANTTLQEKLKIFADMKIKEQKEKDSIFLAENKNRPGVQTTASGLQYEILTKGTGTVHPTDASKVKVHYTGKLLNGKKFDSSIDRGEPLVFGVGQVIKGWTEALKLMKQGDKWNIYIPSELGYGDRGAGANIPPGAALVFEVEILEVL